MLPHDKGAVATALILLCVGCNEHLQPAAVDEAQSGVAPDADDPPDPTDDSPQVVDPSALNADQQLLVAAFQLDVERVDNLLDAGADVDARFELEGDEYFKNKWTLGYPMAAANWTPLLAVANSHRLPDPETPTQNTSEDLDRARREAAQVPLEIIEERNDRRVQIARALIEAGADLNLEDGHGATALYDAAYHQYEELSLLLIESGADVNTKTGIYIDGTYDNTPLHRASNQSSVLKALLKAGANVSAKNSAGETPLHWACSDGNLEAVQALVEAGADVNAEGNEGRRPIDRLHIYPRRPETGAAVDPANERFRALLGSGQEEEIRRLLLDAGAETDP